MDKNSNPRGRSRTQGYCIRICPRTPAWEAKPLLPPQPHCCVLPSHSAIPTGATHFSHIIRDLHPLPSPPYFCQDHHPPFHVAPPPLCKKTAFLSATPSTPPPPPGCWFPYSPVVLPLVPWCQMGLRQPIHSPCIAPHLSASLALQTPSTFPQALCWGLPGLGRLSPTPMTTIF